MAKQHAEESLHAVRGAIGKDAQVLDSYLMDTLAIPIGDDPRVLDICGEIVKQGQRAEDMWPAMQALEVISISHLRFFGRAKQKATIGEYAGIAFDKGDSKTKSRALATLVRLGGKFRDEAYRRGKSLITKTPPASDADRQLYVDVIQLLIESEQKEALASIRQATRSYDLIAYYKGALSKSPSASIKMEGEKFIVRWQAVIERE